MEKMSWTELRTWTLADLLKGPCLEITGDGQPAFILVVRPEGVMHERIVGNCGLIDASRGNPPLGGFPEPEPEAEPEPVPEPDPWAFENEAEPTGAQLE